MSQLGQGYAGAGAPWRWGSQQGCRKADRRGLQRVRWGEGVSRRPKIGRAAAPPASHVWEHGLDIHLQASAERLEKEASFMEQERYLQGLEYIWGWGRLVQLPEVGAGL